jgi:hypothetical protein
MDDGAADAHRPPRPTPGLDSIALSGEPGTSFEGALAAAEERGGDQHARHERHCGEQADE